MKALRILLLAIIIFPFVSIGQSDVDVFLIARNTGSKVLSDGNEIRTFGYAQLINEIPPVPGPTIVVNEGDSVHIDMWNVSQGAPHTIHLHGLDVDQQNDGVPHLSFEVGHMDHGYYHFKAPHPGTYLYHCHVVSTIHVQAGMYGMIIVKPSDGSNTTWDGGFEYTDDFVVYTSEIDTTWHTDEVLDHPHDSMMQMIPIPNYNPQFFLVNGLSDQQLNFENGFQGEVDKNYFFRLANIGFLGNRYVFPTELNAKIVSSDGRPLPNEIQSDTVFVFPGERYGVITNANWWVYDSLQVDYVNMNTQNIENTQYVTTNVVNVSVEEELQVPANIFPNPSADYINLEGSFNDVNTIKIYDVNGKLIDADYELQSNSIRLNLNPFSEGVYFIHVIMNSGQFEIYQAVKK